MFVWVIYLVLMIKIVEDVWRALKLTAGSSGGSGIKSSRSVKFEYL